MTEKELNFNDTYSHKKAFFYSFGSLADVIAYQMFTFLIFIFYYAVMRVNVILLTIGYILWSFWNAFNDPLIGIISDRTSTRWGRRKPYVIAAIIPLAILLVIVWMPPSGSELVIFMYFMIMLILFDTFYTMFSLSQTALFPEMFEDIEDRAKANNIVQIFIVVALLLGTLLPSFFITQYDNPKEGEYITAGIVIAVIFVIMAIIFVLFGIKEKAEFSKDAERAPSFFKSIKMSLSNKSLRWYVPANFAIWYIFGLVVTITALYCSFVLGIKDSFMISLLLGLIFISAAGFMVLWRFIILKIGVKKGLILAFIVTIVLLAPFMFITDLIGGIIVFTLLGIGFAGLTFCRDIVMANIIDDDEIKTGIRREASFYGVNAIFIRLSTIAVVISISLVFTSVGWAVFDPKGDKTQIILGLRILMFVFPACALGLAILFMSRFPITKEKSEEIKREIKRIHAEKRSKIST